MDLEGCYHTDSLYLCTLYCVYYITLYIKRIRDLFEYALYKFTLHLLTYYMQGVLGTQNSGKSALVHRYLTGSYLQEESSEGNFSGLTLH